MTLRQPLVFGSLAYDSLLFSPQSFDELLGNKPYEKADVLALDARREFGGCAGNICYNLHLIGQDATIVGTVGTDGLDYANRILRWHATHEEPRGTITAVLQSVQDKLTAQAYIFTDAHSKQFNVFSPAALAYSGRNDYKAAVRNASLVCVAPDDLQAMLDVAMYAHEHHVPVLFDPGQQLAQMNKQYLEDALTASTFVAVNKHELDVLLDKLAMTTIDGVIEQFQLSAIIMTDAENGCVIYTDEDHDIRVHPAPLASNFVDPTGCGDAFRSGLIAGIQRGYSWLNVGRLANIMGAYKAETRGCQNHAPSVREIHERFQAVYGEPLPDAQQ